MGFSFGKNWASLRPGNEFALWESTSNALMPEESVSHLSQWIQKLDTSCNGEDCLLPQKSTHGEVITFLGIVFHMHKLCS